MTLLPGQLYRAWQWLTLATGSGIRGSAGLLGDPKTSEEKANGLDVDAEERGAKGSSAKGSVENGSAAVGVWADG